MPDERGDGGEWTLGGDCRSGRDSGAALMPEAVVGPLVLPATPDEWALFLRARCDSGLDRIRELIAQLKDGEQRSPIATLGVWNDANVALSNVFAILSLIRQVHPLEEVRVLADGREQEATKLATDIGLDQELYAVLAAIDDGELDQAAARVLRLTLRDFRRSGVDQDEETRDRLRELSERETVRAQEFSKNIRDDVRSIKVEPVSLVGLPQDFVEAHPAGDDGLVTITTDYPDLIPFRTFSTDSDARRALTREFLNRAWPINDQVLTELLALRAEHARRLRYSGWPDYDAEIKMVGSGAAIEAFIDQVATSATSSAQRDYDVLLRRLQADRPDATAVDSADAMYYAEVINREHFEVDAHEVRRYFEFGKVRAGLLDVTGRLFGLEYRPVENAPTWHEDVTVHDVYTVGSDDADGERLGRIYLDLHPREGKYKHAAQFALVPGIADRQLPEGALVCNFPTGLMEHSNVVTLFHEFGHLLHHIVAGRHEWSRFSGVATEWDFVEAPSQMLEEWAWNAEVLRSFATDQSEQPIPEELVAKMRDANDFGKGYFARTQMFYASLSYVLHNEEVDDITELVKTLQNSFSMFPYQEDTHFHAAFGHLEGYTSAYYTYMWSLVIAKDLFSAFDRDHLFDTTTSYRYRDTILAAGGSEDAADLVADFLGRPYNVEAFTRWLDTAPTIRHL
jgi:thimet oligopeptidase